MTREEGVLRQGERAHDVLRYVQVLQAAAHKLFARRRRLRLLGSEVDSRLDLILRHDELAEVGQVLEWPEVLQDVGRQVHAGLCTCVGCMCYLAHSHT